MSLGFAKQRGKPLMVCECGSGGDNGKLGPIDDAAFPVALANMLITSGVPIIAVMIWATDQSDGHWGFLNGDRPNKAAAWRRSFSAQDAASNIVLPTAAPAAVAPISTVAAPANPAANAVAELKGRNGKSAVLSFDPTVKRNFYANDTGLASNVYVWPASDGSYVISPDNAWALPTIKLHRNGCNVRAQGFASITTD